MSEVIRLYSSELVELIDVFKWNCQVEPNEQLFVTPCPGTTGVRGCCICAGNGTADGILFITGLELPEPKAFAYDINTCHMRRLSKKSVKVVMSFLVRTYGPRDKIIPSVVVGGHGQ